MSGGAAGILLVISAPSGAGKTTVCANLLAKNPSLVRAVTCTTRAPREGEEHGVDYYFLSEKEFLTRVDAGDFLEHALVYGRHYGTLKSEVLRWLREGKDVLLNIDVQGAALLRKRAEEDEEIRDALVTVFLTPATPEELELRLRSRGSDPDESIETRLEAAAKEVADAKSFDYLIISHSREEDRRRMELVLEAERLRQPRASVACLWERNGEGANS